VAENRVCRVLLNETKLQARVESEKKKIGERNKDKEIKRKLEKETWRTTTGFLREKREPLRVILGEMTPRKPEMIDQKNGWHVAIPVPIYTDLFSDWTFPVF
jgi:hypothetical protein